MLNFEIVIYLSSLQVLVYPFIDYDSQIEPILRFSIKELYICVKIGCTTGAEAAKNKGMPINLVEILNIQRKYKWLNFYLIYIISFNHLKIVYLTYQTTTGGQSKT